MLVVVVLVVVEEGSPEVQVEVEAAEELAEVELLPPLLPLPPYASRRAFFEACESQLPVEEPFPEEEEALPLMLLPLALPELLEVTAPAEEALDVVEDVVPKSILLNIKKYEIY